jgi:hypothetical protein
MESEKKKEFRRYEPLSSRAVHRSAYPLPAPPKMDKSTVSTKAEDTRTTEAARASNVDDKVKALKQYRRARGLCDKCAEKWTPGHKCSHSVQLHAIQEIWDLFSDDEDPTDDFVAQIPHLYACLSEAVAAGSESAMSMRLWGSIQGVGLLILLDSGSSHTFLSHKIVTQLSGVTPLEKSFSVQVANGTVSTLQTEYRYAQDLSRVTRRQTPPPSAGGLWRHHVPHDARPCLSAREGSNVATCSAASDPASRRRRAPASPHVPLHQARLPAREGSGVATCPTALDPPPSTGGLRRHHVPHGARPASQHGRAPMSPRATWLLACYG